jgi:hypothetical protein
VNLSEEGKKLVEKLDDELVQDDLTDTQKAKAKWTQLEALIGSENRITTTLPCSSLSSMVFALKPYWVR